MVRINECTLREGMQAAAGTFTEEQSVDVVKLLVALGVDAIECGHPAVSEAERRRVSAVVETAGEIPVIAHARADVRDIDAVAATGANWVGIFLGINRQSRSARLNGQAVEAINRMIETSISHARDRGLRVRFTVEDGSRTGPEELRAACELALASGADRLCFADTLGVLEPAEVGQRIADLRRWFPDTELEAHLHDDRGLALANALCAVDNGVDWISTSINGLGERAGIVDLGSLALNLHRRGERPLANGPILPELSRRVAAYARSAPDHRRCLVGRDVFHHVAKLHIQAVERDPSSYEWFDPALIGRSRSVSANGRSPATQGTVIAPKEIPASELRHHRDGPGTRYVLVDDRLLPGAGQYCIARRIPEMEDYGAGHVDTHVHACDSLFVFLGEEEGYRGLRVEVTLGEEVRPVESPASVFIPAGVPHSYCVLGGAGTYINHVLAGSYNESLLDPVS
jgi:2-isopropylmalate synthase